MSTYQTEAEQIKRRRAIADSLRASGNEALPASIHTGGRFDAPVSGWQYANKAVQQLLGGYMSGRADKSQKKLDEQDKQVLSELIAAKRDSTAPDVNGEIDPSIQSDAGPTQVPAASKPLSKAERMQKLQAAMLRGTEFGGSAAGMAGELTERELLPPVRAPYNLGADETRFDENNAPVAVGLPRTVREANVFPVPMEIVDPNAKGGHRTIDQHQWKGEQEWKQPPTPAAGSTPLTPAQDKQVETLARAIYNYEKSPLSLSRNNPLNAAAMERAIQIGEENGEPYREYEYPARSAALNEFNRGIRGRTVTAFNTMLDHLGTLRNAGKKLNNGESLDWNSLGNWVTNRTGKTGPAAFETLRQNISGEVVKAITGTAGAESDRMHALANDLKNASPENMEDILQSIEALGAGQIRSQQSHFTGTTGLGEARFQARLSPRARELLGSTPTANSPPPNAPVTKVIGGKTYVKTGPGPADWEEQ